MITVTFSALWIGLPLFILGVVGFWLSVLLPLGFEIKKWWPFLSFVAGVLSVSGIWVIWDKV